MIKHSIKAIHVANTTADNNVEQVTNGKQLLPVLLKSAKKLFVKWQEVKKVFQQIKAFMFAVTAEEAGYRRVIEASLSQQIKPAVIFGGTAIAVAIGFFVIWGGVAPLDSAATASGIVVLSGNHKVIQHLEGGVIEQILVKEGQAVEERQELVVLNNTYAKANLQMILSQLRIVKAIELRLRSAEADAEEPDFNHSILDMKDPEVQMLINNQRALFHLERKALQLALDVAEQKIAQKHEEISVFKARERSYIARLSLAREQLEASGSLYKQGLETKTNLFRARALVEELEGGIHEARAGIAKAYEEISESRLHKINAENDFKQKITEKYRENKAHVLELEQKLQAAGDVLARTVIKAPNSGIITGLKYHTIGGVIPPGGLVMDIVPQDDVLLIEADVSPQHIESVRCGLKAKVQLDAFKTRLVPRVDGEVVYVSADRITNERGETYYTVKIKIPEEELNRINSVVKLYPGMPATVFIVKGTRTFLQYLLSPIIDSFHRAFKEA